MSSLGSTNLLTTHSHCSCSWLSKSAKETCKGLSCSCSAKDTPIATCCTKLPTIVVNPHYRKGFEPSLATVDCHAGTCCRDSNQPNLKEVDEWVTTGRFTRDEVKAFEEDFKKNPKTALVTATKGLASRLSDSLHRSGDSTQWRIAILPDGDVYKNRGPMVDLMRGWGMDIHTFKGSELTEHTAEDDASIASHTSEMTSYDPEKQVYLCPSHKRDAEYERF